MNVTVKQDSALAMYTILKTIMDRPATEAVQGLQALFTEPERLKAVLRGAITEEIQTRLRTEGGASVLTIAEKFDCSESLVRHIWRDIRDEAPVTEKNANFCLAIPQETRAQDLVEDILLNGGFSMNMREKVLVDNTSAGFTPIPYMILRGNDIPLYLKAGTVQRAFLGKDKIEENASASRLKGTKPVQLDIPQKFCPNTFRMCLAIPASERAKAQAQGISYFNGKVISTSYPATLKDFLKEKKITAKVIRLAGKIEGTIKALESFKIQAIMDIVETGDSLNKAGLVPFGNPQARFGDPLYEGDMSFIGLKGAQRPEAEQQIWQRFTARLESSRRLAA